MMLIKHVNYNYYHSSHVGQYIYGCVKRAQIVSS